MNNLVSVPSPFKEKEKKLDELDTAQPGEDDNVFKSISPGIKKSKSRRGLDNNSIDFYAEDPGSPDKSFKKQKTRLGSE